MRILIVHNSYKESGGEITVVNNQTELLKNKGDEVYTYITDNKEIDKYGKMDKLRLLKNAYSSPRTVRDITEIIKEFRPDIAHVHNVYPLISPVVYKVLHDNEIPIVQTLHNYRFICPNGLFFINGEVCTKCLDKKSYYQCGFNKCYHNSFVQSFWYADIVSRGNKWFRYIDKFVALNNFVKDKMTQRGFDESKITIVPNFSYKADIKQDIHSKKEYFLYLGRLSPEKGLETLLEAIDNINGIKLYVAGDGVLKDKIMSYEHKGKVKYLGWVSGEKKDLLIKNARALIVPSECHENFPLVILEAMALGTPTIASKMGGMQYLVEDGVSGKLFEAGNHKDLIEKIKYFSDDFVVSKMGKMAQEVYENNYTPEIIYNELMQVYRDVI